VNSTEKQELTCEYSLLVLFEEESEGFGEFINRLKAVMLEIGKSFEIIILANGTEFLLKKEIDVIDNSMDNIVAYGFYRKTTQAACLEAGMKESKGRVIIVCGAYQQISHDSFVKSIHALNDEVDIVCPYRKKRVDPYFNQIQSKSFNLLVKKLFGTQLNDLSCTVRIFRRDLFNEVKLYGNMYRFLPIIGEQNGFKCREVESEHYEERGPTGIYKLNEYISRLIDITTAYFNVKFVRKPLRFFMRIGTAFMLISFLLGVYLIGGKLFGNIPIGNRPELMISIFMLACGIQITAVGLLGEMITFALGRKKPEYRIAEYYQYNENSSVEYNSNCGKIGYRKEDKMIITNTQKKCNTFSLLRY
jgi:dolichol-phosphate mannosyltransferase